MSDTPDDASADDARLLADLTTALGPDPLPDGLLTRADGLLGWMDVDEQLALLLEETSVEPSGVRSAGTATATTYELADGSVQLELSVGPGEVRGQVLSGTASRVVVERADGATVASIVDDLGQFAFTGLSHGPARLRLERGSALPVVTEWFVL
jgi:hypothetical protein